MPPPIAAIFVSSTWLDLQPERKAVADALHRFREAKFIGMEYFGSRDETTRQASLDEVDRSQLYVGIFAGRYGSGITEAEYRRAREQGIDCLIYLKKDDVPQQRADEASDLIKLIALKNELRRNHTATFFRDAQELAAEVTADIHRWLFDKFLRAKTEGASAEQVCAPLSGAAFANGHDGYRLRGGAEHGAVVDTVVLAAPTPRPLPLQPSLRPFRGLLDRQMESADALAGLAGPGLLELTGPAGIGKTALLRHLAYHPEAAKFPGGVIYCGRVGRQAAADLLQFCFDAFYDSPQVCHLGAGAILQLLRKQKALVLLDDVALSAQDLEPVFNALSECAIAVATTNRMTFEGKTLYLRGLPVDDAVSLIEREYGASLSDADRLAAKHLALRLGQNPGQILQVTAAIREQQSALAEFVAQFPDEENPAEQLPKQRSEPERKILAALVAVAAPLTKAALAAATSLPELDTALASLEANRMVQRHALGYTVSANLSDTTALNVDMGAQMERLVDHFIGAAGQLRDNPEPLLDQAEAIAAARDWAAGQEHWPKVLQLCRAMDTVLCINKRWGAWQGNLELAHQAAQKIADAAASDWANHQLGSRALCLGDGRAARRLLTQALEGRIARGDHWAAAVTRHNLDLLDLPVIPKDTASSSEPTREGSAQSLWSRFSQLPLALKGSILALLCAVIALVANQQLNPPPPTAFALSFSPSPLEFRSSAIHVPALEQSVTVTNNAATPVTLGPVAIAGAAQEDFFINENSCAEKTLPAGGDCRVSLIFTPSGGGPRVAALTFTDAARRETAQVVLRGQTGLPQTPESGRIALTPNPLDFGAREIGSEITSSLTLTNSAPTPLRVAEIIISGAHRQDFADAESDCREKEIPQRMSCAIPITFKPSAGGARTATLTVVSEDGGKEELTLSGTGIEISAPSLSPRPANLGFGAVDVGQRLTKNITLQQQGAGALEVTSITVEGSARRDFIITQNDCQGGRLSDGRSCQLAITFAPIATGSREANLVIVSSGASAELRVSLDGAGKIAATRITLAPEPLEFAEQALDSPPMRRTVTIRNHSSASVPVGRAEIIGPDARQFAIAGNDCNDSLAAESSCNFTLRYAPKSAGGHRAVLRIEPLGSGAREVTLRGSAAMVQKPLAVATPARLSFAVLSLGGSRTEEVKIENRGRSDLVIARAELRGAPSFTLLNQCPTPIKEGAPPCILRIRFAPRTSGSHDGELWINHNGAGSPLTVPIEGAGRERPLIAAVSVNPASLSFAEQSFGTGSQAQQITIGSSGSSNLSIGTIAIEGVNAGDFRVTSESCARREITPGGRCQISVIFAPRQDQRSTRRSERTATVTLTHNAPGNRTTVLLRGIAVPRPSGPILRDRIEVIPGLTTGASGWCCAAGKVNESSAASCTARQGFFSTNKAAAEERCAAPIIR